MSAMPKGAGLHIAATNLCIDNSVGEIKSRISKPVFHPRRSSRLKQKLERLIDKETGDRHQLPSPSSTEPHKQVRDQKKKRKIESSHENDSSKRPRISGDNSYRKKDFCDDPVAHWAATSVWPESFGRRSAKMSLNKTTASSSVDNSSKRKSASTHRSDRLERLADNGVFMKNSALTQKSSKNLCSSYLRDDHKPSWWPSYPPEKIPDILDRVDGLNEGRIQRDILPWIVPSAENLFFCGEPIEEWIGEEISAEWTRCATMGSTRPKPDYTAGLLRKAFTKDEVERLRNYASPARPFMFTPELSFPFLICEAKSGEGLNKAHRQNIHSASIAVRSIIELYKAAFGKSDPARVSELYGKVLVFTISHNQNRVYLYGHYAVPADGSPEKLEFYRYEIALFSLTLGDGRDRYKTYSFVRNVYEKFAPEHRKLIKTAVACLSVPGARLPFSAPSIALESDSQANSQDTPPPKDAGFQVPSEPASTMQRRELSRVRAQNDKLQDQVNKLINQQEEMRQQRVQEREEMRQQLAQQKEIIELLKQSKK